MKKWMINILICFQALFAIAQVDKNFTPSPIQDTIPANVYEVLKVKSELAKANVSESRGQVNTYLKSLYDKRFQGIVENFNKDNFILHSEQTDYLEKILSTIYQANPQLPRESSIYSFRSASPNALSFGDGTIGFTLGLLARMENEDEIAFVICHELAHYYLKHADHQMAQLAKINFDKEIGKKIDAARKSEYGKYDKLNDIFLSMGFSISHHSRAHENEADSIGMLYFSRTKYNPWAAIRLMEILDSADVSKHPQNIDLASHFNLKEFPFKKQWSEYSKSTMWHASAKINDSLRSHPDCADRILALKRQLKQMEVPEKHLLKNDPQAKRIASTAAFDLIETEYHFKQYGKALFRALIWLEHYPHNIYLNAMVGRCLYFIFMYEKAHELSKVLELPAPQFPENYDRFLSFVHKLRLTELEALAYYFTITRNEDFFRDEEFIYTLWLCSQLPMSEIDADKVKDGYLELFPQGKYIHKLKINSSKTYQRH